LEGGSANPWMHYADESGSPYMVQGDQWIGFEDARSIAQKVRFCFKLKQYANICAVCDRWTT